MYQTIVFLELYCNVNILKDCKKLYVRWFDSCEEEDLRISHQIKELIEVRDSIVPSSLALHEVKDLIEFLCIS